MPKRKPKATSIIYIVVKIIWTTLINHWKVFSCLELEFLLVNGSFGECWYKQVGNIVRARISGHEL